MRDSVTFPVTIEFDTHERDGYMKHFIVLPETFAAVEGDLLVCELVGRTFSRVVWDHPDGSRRLKFGEGWLAELGLDVGDTIELTLQTDPDPDYVELAPELEEALAADPVAEHAWESLTPGRRRTLAYGVTRAKRPETRRRKARELVAELKVGR